MGFSPFFTHFTFAGRGMTMLVVSAWRAGSTLWQAASASEAQSAAAGAAVKTRNAPATSEARTHGAHIFDMIDNLADETILTGLLPQIGEGRCLGPTTARPPAAWSC